MQNALEFLEIENFKSIKHLKMDCKRINIFIGKPNVGKSNILEAISLLGFPYEQNKDKFLSSFIRYEGLKNLFYDSELQNIVKVKTNNLVAFLRYHLNNIKAFDIFLDKNEEKWNKIANQNITINEINILLKKEDFEGFYSSIDDNSKIGLDNYIKTFTGIVKKYDFNKVYNFENQFPLFLLPPSGDNLFTILYQSKELAKEASSFFNEYGLQLVLVTHENRLIIQKNLDGIVYQYPYSGVADTLQRMIFYLAAIHSNKDSVLILEEPEVHSFPPYTRMLANRITDYTDNQYFIATHSPYLLYNLIENTPNEDLAIFITYFDNYETKVKLLTEEQINEILSNDIDIFFNLDRFLDDEQTN
jgi:AAA15 family ATPase/GTPase